MIKNVNTIEEYRNADKPAILQLAGKTVGVYFCLVIMYRPRCFPGCCWIC